jgi:hypothetical protein
MSQGTAPGEIKQTARTNGGPPKAARPDSSHGPAAFVERTAPAPARLQEISVPIPTIECHPPDRDFDDLQAPPASRAEALASLAASTILKGIFASIVGPLHKSRRRQARHIIRQHRHLIASGAKRGVEIRKIAMRRS